MPRTLKHTLIILGLLIAGLSGYWFGVKRAQTAYGEHFFSETFSREYHEARHDLATLQLLAENKTVELFQVAQYRYYSRLMLAADAAAQSSNPSLAPLLKAQLAEAQAFQKSHPYQFPTEKEQKKWVSLISSPQ